MGIRYLDDEPQQQTGSRIRYLDEPAATAPTQQVDPYKQVLEEMPWAQRQLVAAGGQLAKAGQGIAQLFGAERDAELERAASTAAEEAPVGAIVGDIAKYAPAMLASGIAVPAAIAGGIGAATDPTGNRISTGLWEAGMTAVGGKIGEKLPIVAGKLRSIMPTQEGIVGRNLPSAVSRFLPSADDRMYGSLDRAREAVQKIYGGKGSAAAQRLGQVAGQDIRTAQALAGVDDAGRRAAVMEDLLASKKEGITPEVEAFYANQLARQEQARQAAMVGMAKGETTEQSQKFLRDFMAQAEQELGSRRAIYLAQLAYGGEEAAKIIPKLSEAERRYVSALQQQGRMATEAAQQGVYAIGERAARNQLIDELPQGSYPRDPRIVQPEGAVAGAYPVPGQPRVPPRYAANVGPQRQFAEAADELGDVAASARAEADALRQQLSELPSPFTAAPIRDAVESMGTRIGGTTRQVADAVMKELRLAGDDPAKIAEIRRLGVNQLIGDLIDTGKLSKKDAAAALTDVKAIIDKQLGPDMVDKYFKPYAKKLAYRDSVQAADELRLMQRDNPEQFMRTIRGDNPDFLEKYSMTAKDMLGLMGQRRMGELQDVAGQMARDKSIAAAKSGEGAKRTTAAIQNILEDKSFISKLPPLLNRYVVIANAAIAKGEMKLNTGMYKELEKAMQDPQAMLRLIEMSPPEVRSQMVGLVKKLGRTGGAVAAGSGESVIE